VRSPAGLAGWPGWALPRRLQRLWASGRVEVPALSAVGLGASGHRKSAAGGLPYCVCGRGGLPGPLGDLPRALVPERSCGSAHGCSQAAGRPQQANAPGWQHVWPARCA
jgi:hypothetical protein